MTFGRFVLFLIITTGLPACTSRTLSPFSVDPDKGNISLELKEGEFDQFGVFINGLNALKEGHLFQGRDSLVLISNRDGIDLITVFKGTSEQASMIITLINPKDTPLKISSLKIIHQTGTDSGSGRISISASGENETLWQWLDGGPDPSVACSLKLSESSILLLPEERIVLPPLRFFSHLCSYKASP